MNILIIGNGFDLAHGLKTSYANFLDLIRDCPPNSKMNADFSEGNLENFYHSASTLLGSVRKGTVYTYMRSKYELNKGWIDFENELREIVDGACDFRQNLTETHAISNGNRLTFGNELMPDWAENISPFMHYFVEYYNINQPKNSKNINIDKLYEKISKQIYDFIELFRQYLCWIDKYQVCEVHALKLFNNLHIDHLLSFNYTCTCPHVYGEKWKLSEDNICFVHGRVENNMKNHIVMGIGSDYYDAYKHTDFLPFFKFYQCYKYETNTSFLKWLPDIVPKRSFSNPGYKIDHNSDPEKCNIYIYGHSLDPTDENILLPFFNYSPEGMTVKIVIYYLDNKCRLSLEQNLVKILGRENFTKYLSGENPKISFQKIPK